MAKSKGTFIIDDSIPQEEREEISDRLLKDIESLKNELSEREPILSKRKDFFEGNHHKWTNVVGLTDKMQQGHILAVFNYVYRFSQKLHQSLTNSIPQIKIKPKDESDEIETSRAEAVEQAIYDVLQDNKFFNVVFKRSSINQIRDGDFSLDCKVLEDSEKGKHIEITQTEDMGKIMVWWDDASGSSFSGIAFRDLQTLTKIKREFGFDAEPLSDSQLEAMGKGDHVSNQYGMMASNPGGSTVPSGNVKLKRAEVIDYWGYEVIKNEVKIVNIIFINKEMVQFVITDYRSIPRFIGHSFVTAGKPWSMSFIDPLIDPQVELNDRTSEEGDMIRIGSNVKFLAINMKDFDGNSVKPGSGQVIFIEGEGVDFRPLQTTLSNVPNEAYINRTMEHLFNLGLPKIALSAGTAPYTGRVAAIQYQAVVDIVTDLRIQWEIVLEQLIDAIQQYFIDYFPETHLFMTEHLTDPATGEAIEGGLVKRKVEFDWENVLPLSRSDKVVDASTLRDRGAISLGTYLSEAGFRNPSEEIKKLKKESKDEELMVLLSKFNQFAPGVVQAQLEAQKRALELQEEQAATMGNIQETVSAATPKSTPPLMTPEQNSGRRGISSSGGTPTGQTATQKGAVAQTTQNINAKNGV